MNNMVDLIKVMHKDKLIAFIIKANFKKKGLEFFTPNRFGQQLSYMNRPRGYNINPHSHPLVARQVKSFQEVIFVRTGKIRVDFYDKNKHYLESRIIQQGDVVFLASGGHGFEFIQDSELIEVKQGPFFKKIQPVRFEAIAKEKIKIKNDTD